MTKMVKGFQLVNIVYWNIDMSFVFLSFEVNRDLFAFETLWNAGVVKKGFCLIKRPYFIIYCLSIVDPPQKIGVIFVVSKMKYKNGWSA